MKKICFLLCILALPTMLCTAQTGKSSFGLELGYENTSKIYGYETSAFYELFSNKMPNVSFYTRFNYHFADEILVGETVECKKYLLEVGAARFFPLIKEKLYPYISLGLGAGLQEVEQKGEYKVEIVLDDNLEHIFEAASNLGIEYRFTKALSFHLKYRMILEHSGQFHSLWGGGLKYSF